jgi:hypothetical protein
MSTLDQIPPTASTPTVDRIADILARAYDGKPVDQLRDEHAEPHREAAAAVVAEVSQLQAQVDRVRSWAVGHEYRWLLALLDGHGAYGGHL